MLAARWTVQVGEAEASDSRFAFFNVDILVTASKSEQLIVKVVGRHGDRMLNAKRQVFRRAIEDARAEREGGSGEGRLRRRGTETQPRKFPFSATMR